MLAVLLALTLTGAQSPSDDQPPPPTATAAQAQPPETPTPAAEPDPVPDPQQPKADDKKPPTPEHTGIHALFHNLVEDVKLLPSKQNLYIAGIGGGLALAAHPADASLNAKLVSHYDTVNTFFAPGKYLGDTAVQVAASLGTYAFGRILDEPKTSHLGMDLVQAQLMSELLVQPIKFATQRERPDHSDSHSFPSGHAAITFATATVIERHLGWKRSLLAYGVASYVAASRLHDNVHYLSDVVFGAAVGSIAGRTVVHHASDYWAFAPVNMPGGGVALFATRTFGQ